MSVDETQQDDQLLVHAQRETKILLVAFAVCLIWSVSVSYFLGYNVSAENIGRTVWGIPRWVFWGIAVPWMASNLFTVYFCMFCMADDPLGEVHMDDPSPESRGEPRS